MLRRIGILGAGSVARYHAAAARALGAEVVAACTKRPDSPNWEKFRQHAPEARRVEDGAALLADNDVEAVVACLDWAAMPEWLERLLACPKPVLLEKPIGLTVAETKAAIDAAGTPGAERLVGYNRRFYETVERLGARIAAGGLKAADAVISESMASHIARHGREVVPHLLAFASSHSLDLLLHLFGPLVPTAIAPYADVGEAAPFISYNGVLRTGSGVPLALALNADDPTPAGIRCRFDDGTTWHLSPLEVLTVYHGTDIDPATAEFNVRRYTPRVIERHIVDAELKPGFKAQMAAFLTREFGPGATVDDAMRVLELIGSIETSAAGWPVDQPGDRRAAARV